MSYSFVPGSCEICDSVQHSVIPRMHGEPLISIINDGIVRASILNLTLELSVILAAHAYTMYTSGVSTSNSPFNSGNTFSATHVFIIKTQGTLSEQYLARLFQLFQRTIGNDLISDDVIIKFFSPRSTFGRNDVIILSLAWDALGNINYFINLISDVH